MMVFYKQNDVYKIFYGTWRYTEIVSQHIRLGGDTGYEELIGTTVTYHPDYFQDSEERYFDPISFKQKVIEELLPDHEFFIFVQTVNESFELNDGNSGLNNVLIGMMPYFIMINTSLGTSFVDDGGIILGYEHNIKAREWNNANETSYGK